MDLALDKIEEDVALHPSFGAPTQIIASVESMLRFAVDIAATHNGAARRVAASLARCTQDVLVESMPLRHHLGRHFSAAAGHSSDEIRGQSELTRALARWRRLEIHDHPELLSGLRSDKPVTIWCPSDPEANDIELLWKAELAPELRYAGEPRLCDVGDSMRRTLADAALTLRDSVPRLTQSAFQHVNTICVFDIDHRNSTRPPYSASKYTLPGAIFISTVALSEVRDAAEALLHEACHQKMYDLSAVRPMYREGYLADDSRTVVAPWVRPVVTEQSTWVADRVLVGFHVYALLALFLAKVSNRDNQRRRPRAEACGPLVNNYRQAIRTALERASFLGCAIREGNVSAEVGPFGRDFVDWLWSVVLQLSEILPRGDIDTLAAPVL